MNLTTANHERLEAHEKRLAGREARQSHQTRQSQQPHECGNDRKCFGQGPFRLFGVFREFQSRPVAYVWILCGLVSTAAGAGTVPYAIVEKGDILVANYYGHSVVCFNPSTGRQTKLGDFTSPANVTLSPAGEL